MHPLYIVDWFEAKDGVPDGYESMIESHFQEELSLNEERQKAHEAYLRDEEAYKKRAESDLEQSEIQNQKEAEREYRQFIQWRKNNRKVKDGKR
jgi:hypothetical protein